MDVKKKINEIVDIDNILERVKAFEGVNSDKQLSEIFKLSPQNFSQRKKSGGLLKIIVARAINKNINLDWLFTGKGGMLRPLPESCHPPSEKVSQLLKMARYVLESDTGYADSLSANIVSFNRAVHLEHEVRDQRLQRIEADKTPDDNKVRKGDPPEAKEAIIKQRAM